MLTQWFARVQYWHLSPSIGCVRDESERTTNCPKRKQVNVLESCSVKNLKILRCFKLLRFCAYAFLRPASINRSDPWLYPSCIPRTTRDNRKYHKRHWCNAIRQVNKQRWTNIKQSNLLKWSNHRKLNSTSYHDRSKALRADMFLSE